MLTYQRDPVERGFKSRCESISLGLRDDLGLPRTAPLPPDRLAEHLAIPIVSLEDVPGVEEDDAHQLLVVDPDSWSAITVSVAGREAIIINPRHRGGRPAVDIAHEVAHLLLGHEPSLMSFVGDQDLAIRGYDRAAEEEADWLAGAILLPREALVHIARSRMDLASVLQTYCVSEALYTYRVNITGVNVQFRRGRSRTATR